VAGEASGDLHGAALAAELRRRHPDLRLFGMGGERLRAAGMELLAPITPVVGLVEVLAHLGRIRASLKILKRVLQERRPDLLILIDYPDFNLRVAAQARRLGIPVMYYVSPQVWAWRRGRIKKIAALVDGMAVILPFEKTLYERTGLRTEYVGHPLIEELAAFTSTREEVRARLGLEAGRPVVAILPGSRGSEIDRHLPILFEVAEKIGNQRPDVQLVVPVAPMLPAETKQRLATLADLGVKLLQGRAWEAFRAADAALVASGTATLEAALLGVPTVVYYRLQGFTYLLGRLLIKIPHFSLVNILLGREAVPEFLQERATPENLTRAVLELLSNGAARKKILADFQTVREMLGPHHASNKAADLAEELAPRLHRKPGK